MLQPVVRRTWAPRGRTPIHYSWDRHDRLSVISGLTLAPVRRRIGLYFNCHDSNVTHANVYRFVMSIRRRVQRKLILVMDRWSVHRKAVRLWLSRHARSISIEWLPSYAPELNPAEQIWNRTKYTDLANFLPRDYDHLCHAVRRSIVKTRGRPLLLRSFFAHSRLEL